jgi:hypothetical protein
LTKVAKGHRPSNKNTCIADKLKNKKYEKPPVGTGGMRNPAVHKAFVAAAKECGVKLKPATLTKFGLS